MGGQFNPSLGGGDLRHPSLGGQMDPNQPSQADIDRMIGEQRRGMALQLAVQFGEVGSPEEVTERAAQYARFLAGGHQ